MPLPVEDALPALLAAIEARGMAVLQAPPGAGKTTRVPIALLETRRIAGRIVMLEPRRIAARAAAERMAETLGEPVGRTVGYRIRGESRVSARTRIEVVTEGILTRMIQSDPDLPGIGCVVFDEFHERSLNGDLGLALALECRAALREDLVLLPMSATLDAAPLARLLGDAPVITSRGRAFPVDLIYAEKPARGRGFSAGRAVADAALRALDETEGAILAFLPGIRDLGDAQSALAAAAPGVPVRLLHGGLDLARQRAVLDPGRGAGRRIVLATAIAETSLTVPDVRVVIDAGLARRARFDPGSGMTRLVTERASRAEADQRAGRAGRIAPGRCYRLWTRGEEGAMPSHPPAEIETADLASLALELAVWGSDTPTFLTRPPDAPLAEARALLRALGALDDADRATAHGREMAAIPAHPRIAHMLLAGGGRAAPLLAALLTARPGRRAGADLTAALDELARGRGPRDVVSEAERLARLVPARTDDGPSAAGLLTLAYPDRIAQRRPGGEARYLLSGGKGAVLDSADALASADYLAVGDLDGDRREARIRAALPLSPAELRGLHGERAVTERECTWSPREGRVVARQVTRLGALVLEERPWPDPPVDAVSAALVVGLRDRGVATLGWTGSARRLQARIAWARAEGADLPDLRDEALEDGAERLLAPFMEGLRTAEQLSTFDPLPALRAALGWDGERRLDAAAPAHFTAPTGTRVPIEYEPGQEPTVRVRLQELFGLVTHPVIGDGRKPLRIVLLSPAQRPVQTTMDLPGFWATSYLDVRKEMRGRYPRHPWPEDPRSADPTRRAKRRAP